MNGLPANAPALNGSSFFSDKTSRIVATVARSWDRAKEKLLHDVLDLAEADAAHAHMAIERSAEPEMAELPEGWKTLENGTPAPNWVAGIDEARRVIDLDPDPYHADMAHTAKADVSLVKRRREAAEELRGMFAHVAPDASLADELIADRRAEVRAEERAEAERQRANG